MEKYMYGGGYYPLFEDKKNWRKDIESMKKAGINIVRTAELFNTWDRIEPKEGQYEFKFLDEFFDLCEEMDMKILLGTGTCSPPLWLKKKYEDVVILSNTGKHYADHASYTWACPDNPGYLKEAERYIRNLVNRYKNHNALYAYQLHNEVGFPFMPTDNGGLDIYCYCQHSKNKFRGWIKEKYKTLDALNKAWTWSATNTVCTSWEDVEPSYAKPSAWSSVTRWLDWRLFWMDNFVAFIKWQNDIVKELDKEHITTTNIFYNKGFDAFGVTMGLDQFKMAKVVDIVGYDLYPGSGDKLKNRPEFSSMFLDHARSITKPINKPYWIHELESGPINGWMLGPDSNTQRGEILRNGFECIGHDAKFILYQGWKQWDFQPLHWGGIVDLDGNETKRNIAAGEIGKFLNENSDFLLKASTGKGKIALLTSKENAIVINGVGQESFLQKALAGAYKVFYEKGFVVDFIEEEHLESGYALDYDVIAMPFLTLVSKKTSDLLAKYVEEGGILIGSARCGMIGENGWYNHSVPCHTLKNVFGVVVEEVWSKGDYKLTYNNKNYDGYWHKEKLKVIDQNVDILGRFFDDTAAITINKYGKGQAIYFATQVEAGYVEKKSFILWDVIDDIFREMNIFPRIKLDYVNKVDKEIDAHSLSFNNKEMIIITNYVNESRRNSFFSKGLKNVRVTINNFGKKPISVLDEYGKEIDFREVNGETLIEIKVVEDEIRVLNILWEE